MAPPTIVSTTVRQSRHALEGQMQNPDISLFGGPHNEQFKLSPFYLYDKVTRACAEICITFILIYIYVYILHVNASSGSQYHIARNPSPSITVPELALISGSLRIP